MSTMQNNVDKNKEAVLQVVNAIPRGKVATYGQVAELAGLGRAARFVGSTMKKLPRDTRLPWFRVINAQGKIAFPIDSEGYKRQKQRLQDEGVAFYKQRIDLNTFGWQT